MPPTFLTSTPGFGGTPYDKSHCYERDSRREESQEDQPVDLWQKKASEKKQDFRFYHDGHGKKGKKGYQHTQKKRGQDLGAENLMEGQRAVEQSFQSMLFLFAYKGAGRHDGRGHNRNDQKKHRYPTDRTLKITSCMSSLRRRFFMCVSTFLPPSLFLKGRAPLISSLLTTAPICSSM